MTYVPHSESTLAGEESASEIARSSWRIAEQKPPVRTLLQIQFILSISVFLSQFSYNLVTVVLAEFLPGSFTKPYSHNAS